mgnify:CR=1 FL=1
MQWYTELASGLYGEAGTSVQRWRSDSLYSPGLIETVRHQDTLTARAAVQWYFRPGVSLHLEGRAVRVGEKETSEQAAIVEQRRAAAEPMRIAT